MTEKWVASVSVILDVEVWGESASEVFDKVRGMDLTDVVPHIVLENGYTVDPISCWPASSPRKRYRDNAIVSGKLVPNRLELKSADR